MLKMFNFGGGKFGVLIYLYVPLRSFVKRLLTNSVELIKR